jgi:hypothetical protein
MADLERLKKFKFDDDDDNSNHENEKPNIESPLLG